MGRWNSFSGHAGGQAGGHEGSHEDDTPARRRELKGRLVCEVLECRLEVPAVGAEGGRRGEGEVQEGGESSTGGLSSLGPYGQLKRKTQI